MNRMAAIPCHACRHSKRSACIHRRSHFAHRTQLRERPFVAPESDTFIVVHNPATGAVRARAGRDTGRRARRRRRRGRRAEGVAHAAERRTRHLPAPLRRRIDRARARDRAALAQESGKSVEDASNEAVYAGQITRYHAEWARRIEGEIIPSDTPDENLFLQREPIGVVACLIPFNYPVTRCCAVAPALIAGNTVVVRPSNHTPVSAFEIAKAADDAGFRRASSTS